MSAHVKSRKGKQTLVSSVLLNKLRALYKHLRSRTKKKWDRDIPFEELLFDRWERANELGFGEGASVYHNCYVYGNVKVGNNTWVGPFTILDGSGGLEIGSYCSISSGVHIYTHNTVRWAVSGGKAEYERKPVRIGDACFVGPHAIIQNGVTIGDHCIVAANSFVNDDVLSFTIVGGNPAKRIGRVELKKEGAVEFSYD